MENGHPLRRIDNLKEKRNVKDEGWHRHKDYWSISYIILKIAR